MDFKLIFNKLIADGYSFFSAYNLAVEMLCIPDEFSLNLKEWMKDAPLTDIVYQGISIKDIMNQHLKFGIKYTFPRCIKMAKWKLENENRKLNEMN